MIILLVASITLGIVAFILGIRNEAVYEYRGKVINKIYDAAIDDIRHGLDPFWRHDVYHKVSYYDMVVAFWKPLDSFWEDKSFMEVVKRD